MARSPETPLLRAFNRLAEVLDRKAAARRWYEQHLATLGARAVVDTANQGAIAWVYRRAAGSHEVLPLPAVVWTAAQVGPRLLRGIEIHDGRQRLSLLYDEDGRIADRSLDDRFPGRLVELARILKSAKDGIGESVAFVAGLGDEQYGPGRVHYPVPVPGGVGVVWRVGLMACRRALLDGRVGDAARFVVADGLEGRVVGSGTTREEALAAYAVEVARGLPEQRHVRETITDDYDDDGNLIGRGELPPGLEEPGDGPAATYLSEQPEEEREAWRGETEPERPAFAPEVDPVTGRIDLTGGPIVIRGPTSDAPPVPRRAECVPHVVLSLEPSPAEPPPRGRWIQLLGETGVTRHVVRIEERDGFVLVGADLLGLLDVKGLRAELDRIDAQDPELPGSAEFMPFVRYRARQYRWSPATPARPEDLVPAGGSRGPRFEAGGLDGDALQAMAYRHRRVRRSAS